MTTKVADKRKPKTRSPVLVGEYLVVDPHVCHGQLTFRGTRVPVATVLSYLARGYSLAYLRRSWPEVLPEAIEEAVVLASQELNQRYGNPNK